MKGTEEEVQRQEERVLKRMAELKQEEATTPKIVQEPGRFPIKIIGSEKFIKKTEDALALIQEKSSRSYEIVTNNLSIIQSAQASGVDVFGKTFRVGPLISGSSTVDYGSSIVHDAYHSKLYWDYRREHPGHKGFVKGVFSGQEAEDKCIDVQIDFLRDANAPERMIRGVRLAKHCDYFTIERTW